MPPLLDQSIAIFHYTVIVWTRASPEPPLDSQCSKDAIICHAHLRFPLPKSGNIYFLAALALAALLSMGEWSVIVTTEQFQPHQTLCGIPNPCQAPRLTPWLTIVWCGQFYILAMSCNVFQCLPMYSRQLSGWLCHCNRSTHFSWISLWMDDQTRGSWGTWLEVSLRSKLRKDQAAWEDWRAETGQ